MNRHFYHKPAIYTAINAFVMVSHFYMPYIPADIPSNIGDASIQQGTT
jgi:hypothetical protein